VNPSFVQLVPSVAGHDPIPASISTPYTNPSLEKGERLGERTQKTPGRPFPVQSPTVESRGGPRSLQGVAQAEIQDIFRTSASSPSECRMVELPESPGGSEIPEFEAIRLRQGPASTQEQLTTEAIRELLSMGSTTVEAIVVVGDLRMSTLVLKEAVQPSVFARFIVAFTEAVRALAKESGGWFDKFTGDGFVTFWIPPKNRPTDIGTIPDFCRTVISAADALLARLRRNSRNFPAGTGLSIGIDAGPCELVRVGEFVTVVGSPIVGATRMVEGASARETVLNVYLGSALERDAVVLESAGIRLDRKVVRTKEYPNGQEAFELVFVERNLREEGAPASSLDRRIGKPTNGVGA
jgi:class 3 adenylate cyclase